MRIRNIKPEFWRHRMHRRLSEPAALVALALLNLADDEGRFEADPELIKTSVFPFRTLSKPIGDCLQELAQFDWIVLYQSVYQGETVSLGAIRTFKKHQRFSHPQHSRLPAPEPLQSDSRAALEPYQNDARGTPEPLQSDSRAALSGSGIRDQGSGIRGVPTLPSQGEGSALVSFLENGLIPVEVVTAFGTSDKTSAETFQATLQEQLRVLGYSVERECHVPDRGDGRRGRIDLHCAKGDQHLFIELDRGQAREKSVFKLRQVQGVRIIVSREGWKRTESAEASTEAAPSGLRFDLATECIDYLNGQAGTKFPATHAVLHQVALRLREAANDVAAVKQMIARQAQLWKNDARMKGYLRPVTLFDEEKFPSYFGQREQPALAARPEERRRELEQLIEQSPANKTSLYHRSDASSEDRQKLAEWRRELRSLTENFAPPMAERTVQMSGPH